MSSKYFVYFECEPPVLANSIENFFLSLFTSVSHSMLSVDGTILVATACVIIENHPLATKRHWVRPSLQARSVYGGSLLLEDLKKDNIDPLTRHTV